MSIHPDRATLLQKVAVGLAIVAIWETANRIWPSVPISRPSLIAMQILAWLQGDLYIHLFTTLTEMLTGLVIGCVTGVLAGLVIGRSPFLSVVLRPLIVALYSVPLVSLAPLFIMFFGLDMLPKIVLVAIVVFFLMFFNTFAGVQQIDDDLTRSLSLMGSSRFEEFRKVIAPGSMVWIVAGLKTSLPYALVATTTGEMLAANRGLGFLLTQSAGQLNVTALYSALCILMVLGLLISEAASRFDRWLLRWRHAAT